MAAGAASRKYSRLAGSSAATFSIAEILGAVQGPGQFLAGVHADVVVVVVDQVFALEPDRQPVRRAAGSHELAFVFLREGSEFRGVAAVERQQLLRALDSKPVGGGVVALHLLLDGFVKFAVPGRAAGKKHARHSHLVLGNAAGAAREVLHHVHAALAAVVGENGPVAASVFLLHAGQIFGGGGNGAFGRHAVVTHHHLIRR